MVRRGVPHPATPACSPLSGGACGCGWVPPCRGGCEAWVDIGDTTICTTCGCSIEHASALTHPGYDPEGCHPEASVGETLTVCGCGWRHPDWGSIEWQMWLSAYPSGGSDA